MLKDRMLNAWILNVLTLCIRVLNERNLSGGILNVLPLSGRGFKVLVGAVGSRRELFPAPSLTVFECSSLLFHRLLVSTRAHAVAVGEELGREEEQFLLVGGGGEIHSVYVVGVGVELAVEGLCDAHLVLQDGLPLLSLEDGVTALACAPLQHQEAELLG